MSSDWGYEDHNGPHVWARTFQHALGKRQSPVNIVTTLAESDNGLLKRPLSWKFASEECKTLVNVGCGWKVCISGDGSHVTGGPLQHTYQLMQFHCHWGLNGDCGSEHTVDGKSFSAELHLVFWNKEMYTRSTEAACSCGGLAVLGILLQVGEENPEIQKLCNIMNNIQNRDQTTPIPDGVDLDKLLPEDHTYWTYDGSLTTPPCHETVTWIVFKQPIEVSEEQLEVFRSLKFYCADESCPTGQFEGRIQRNFRPTQPLNGRVIKQC